MNLETAHYLIWDALVHPSLRYAIQCLADDDLSAPICGDLLSILAGSNTYRDLELTLDLTGNLDAPL